MKIFSLRNFSLLTCVLVALCLALASICSANPTHLKTNKYWASGIFLMGSGERFVKVVSINKNKILSVDMYREFAQLVLHGQDAPGFDLSDINLNCDLRVDRNGIYRCSVTVDSVGGKLLFTIRGFDMTKLLPEMGAGNTLYMSIYGEDFPAYNITFSLLGFTAMMNHGFYLYKQVLRY